MTPYKKWDTEPDILSVETLESQDGLYNINGGWSAQYAPSKGAVFSASNGERLTVVAFLRDSVGTGAVLLRDAEKRLWRSEYCGRQMLLVESIAMEAFRNHLLYTGND
jgi:hypothetical protein